ncbi:hypothetical protein ACXYL9_13310 [Qipengyuania sp. CAU 1752]
MTMTIKFRPLGYATCGAVTLLALGGCTQSVLNQPGDAQFGEANRQTMMAQVIDPEPVYAEPATSSGEVAQAAVQRYRDGKVKQPDSIRTTNVGTGSDTGSGTGPD